MKYQFQRGDQNQVQELLRMIQIAVKHSRFPELLSRSILLWNMIVCITIRDTFNMWSLQQFSFVMTFDVDVQNIRLSKAKFLGER